MQQNVVIIGANGGIGQALTHLLAAQQISALLLGRNETALQALATKHHYPYQVCDARDSQQIDTYINDYQAKQGPISAIVNLPGTILLKPCHLITEQEWQTTIETNLTTAFVAAKAASKHMLKTGGSVVLMATAAALIGLPNHEAIAAAKAGVIGLTRSLAATYAKNQLRFNCVAPGLVDTKLAQNITANERALAVSLKAHPIGRIGQPDDIARMLAFLIDPQNDWISGQVFTLDGGLSSIKAMSG